MHQYVQPQTVCVSQEAKINAEQARQIITSLKKKFDCVRIISLFLKKCRTNPPDEINFYFKELSFHEQKEIQELIQIYVSLDQYTQLELIKDFCSKFQCSEEVANTALMRILSWHKSQSFCL